MLKNWKLKPMVQGLVFDMTVPNTGLRMGTCNVLEKTLDKELD